MGKVLRAKRVTIEDLAREIGVSHTAVSKALQGASDVSLDLKRRVQQAARKYNYYPRAAAQLLRNGKTNQIGLIVAAGRMEEMFQGGFLGPLVGHLIVGCGQRQLRYMIEAHHYSVDYQPTHILRSGLVDAALLIGDVGDEERAWLEENGASCPSVSINEPARYCVLADADTGVYDAVARVAALGHRNIAFAGGPIRHQMHRTGLAGFERAVRKFDLNVRQDLGWVHHFDADRNTELVPIVYEWSHKILSQNPRPTVIISHHGDVAARAAIYAAQQMGLRIPQDLSVVCWCSTECATQHLPVLDAIALDYAAISNMALDMLEKLMSGATIPDGTLRLAPKWVQGETLGRPVSN